MPFLSKSVLYSCRSEKSEIFWEIVLVTLNECPSLIGVARCNWSGFFVGQFHLKRWAVIGKKELRGVIRTFHIHVIARAFLFLPEAIFMLLRRLIRRKYTASQ